MGELVSPRLRPIASSLKKEKLLGTGDERETIGPLWDTAKVEPTRRNARPAAKKRNVSPSQRRRRRRSKAALKAAVTRNAAEGVAGLSKDDRVTTFAKASASQERRSAARG